MKLKVCTVKGRPSFCRAGFQFTSNPMIIDVDDPKGQVIKNEAMLLVSEVEETEPVTEITPEVVEEKKVIKKATTTKKK